MAFEYKTARRSGSLADLLKSAGDDELRQRQTDEATARVLDSQYELGEKRRLSDLVDPIRDAALRESQPVQSAPPQDTIAAAGAPVPPRLPAWAGSYPQPEPAQDPYALQTKDLKDRQDLAAREKRLGPAIALSPTVAALEKRRVEDQDAQSGLTKDQIGLNNSRAFLDLKPKLDAIQAKYSAAISKGDFNGMMREMQAEIPPQLLPLAKEYLAQADRQKPNTQFNVMGLMGRDINSLRTTSNNDAKTYLKSKDFLQQAEEAYNKLAQNPNSPQSKAYQQAILDKFVGVSLQKSPTEAQIRLAQSWPGYENFMDLASGKLKDGAIIPPQVIEGMMNGMRQEVIGLGMNLKTQNKTRSRAAELGEINPERIINTPDDVITADSTRFANAGAVPSPHVYTDPEKEARYQAWKKANGK